MPLPAPSPGPKLSGHSRGGANGGGGALPQGDARGYRGGAETQDEGALQQWAEPSCSVGVGTGRARPIWDAGVTALFALTRLGREGRSAALPMGLCFPCPGDSTPPSPDPVSKAAFPLLRVRRPVPRAPVPGRGAPGGPEPRAPERAVGSGGAGLGAGR